MAINTKAGSLDWVIEGTVVLAVKSENWTEFKKFPKNLGRKLILGATSFGGNWYSVSNKVTNMNIFGSLLSVAKMKNMTKEGTCIEKGDYLAWKDMEWSLHGHAKQETLEIEATCAGEPLVDLYYTKFHTMDSCMNLCENLGTRAPSIKTLTEWFRLRDYLKRNLFGKGLDTIGLWLSVKKDTKGDFRDFPTGQKLQNYTHPWNMPKDELDQQDQVINADSAIIFLINH